MSGITLSSKKAPAAIGPYCHGKKCGRTIYTSGQIPIYPDSGETECDVRKATYLVLENILAIIEEGGGTKADIVKMEIFVRDLDDFAVINEVYSEFFGEEKPVRWLVQAARMPGNAVLEAAATAYLGE